MGRFSPPMDSQVSVHLDLAGRAACGSGSRPGATACTSRQAQAPQREQGDGALGRARWRSGSAGARMKSMTRGGPVSFGQTKPSVGAPRLLPGPQPISTKLQQCLLGCDLTPITRYATVMSLYLTSGLIMADQTLVCSRCNSQAELVLKNGKPDTVRCIRCGTKGNYTKIMKEAGEHVINSLADNMNRELEREFRNSKFVKFSSSRKNIRRTPSFIFK